MKTVNFFSTLLLLVTVFSTSAFAINEPIPTSETPTFPGGIAALSEYLQDNLEYPLEARKLAIEGTVKVRFTVSPEGKVEVLKVTKGIGNGCDEAAAKVVAEMPDWMPGTAGKTKVFSLAVRFELD
ncbi:MAG: energy transducer TonB [Bacteroidota bacterium]